MQDNRPCVLIAGPACCKPLLRALEDVRVLRCETLEQAVERIGQEDPHLIIVCYLFDQLRPFRLIHHVRVDLRRPDLPILLVQAVDSHLGDTEVKQMSDAYASIGIDDFVNFSDEIEAYGEDKALQRFRKSVISRLGAR